MIKSRRSRWKRYAVLLTQMIKVYKILVRKPEGNRPLGGPGRPGSERRIKLTES
jgi:hypothetical protein